DDPPPLGHLLAVSFGFGVLVQLTAGTVFPARHWLGFLKARGGAAAPSVGGGGGAGFFSAPRLRGGPAPRRAPGRAAGPRAGVVRYLTAGILNGMWQLVVVALCFGVAFHVGIGVSMELGGFVPYMLCLYMPLLPWEKLPVLWRRLSSKAAHGRQKVLSAS